MNLYETENRSISKPSVSLGIFVYLAGLINNELYLC